MPYRLSCGLQSTPSAPYYEGGSDRPVSHMIVFRNADRPTGHEVPSSNQGVPMPHLQTSAGRVAYSDTGSGPMLVLLHATLHDRHDYDSVLPALAASHRVIAVDWPGHGESDAPAGGRQLTAPLLADVLEEVVLERDRRAR